MLIDQELAALDDWRFKKRMPSRAAAIRELLQRGLAAEGFDVADRDTLSKDFGVVDGSAGSVDPSRDYSKDWSGKGVAGTAASGCG